MAARRLIDDHPQEHVLHQRSWWFWEMEYTLLGAELWRAEIPSVRGAVGEHKKIGDAAILAHAKACEIVARSHQLLHAVEKEFVVRFTPPETRRGCCARCDRCGAQFAPDGEPGCHPGSPAGQPSRCGNTDKIRRRSDCASCGRPYGPVPRPKPVPEGQYDFYGLADDDPDFIEPPKVPEKGDRKWTEDPRSTSIPGTKPLNRKERRLHLKLFPWYGQGPRKRSECAGVARPCVFVSCPMNLYLDVHPETGTIRVNFPHLDPTEMVESCALDVADRGGITCEDLGVYMNVSLEGASQVVDKALAELRTKVEPETMEKIVTGDR